METLSELLSSRWSRLQKKIESFLEEDSMSTEEAKNIQTEFQLQRSPAFFKAFSDGLPSDETDKMAVLFSKMMHIFEYGILLSGEKNSLKSVALFDHGVLRNIKNDTEIQFDLKSLQFAKFVRPKKNSFETKTRSLFPDLRASDELFAIRIGLETVVIVGTTLAKPWLVEHVDNTQQALLKALGI